MDYDAYIKEAKDALDSVENLRRQIGFDLHGRHVSEAEMLNQVRDFGTAVDHAVFVLARGDTRLKRSGEREALLSLARTTASIDSAQSSPSYIHSPAQSLLISHFREQMVEISRRKEWNLANLKWWADYFKTPLNGIASGLLMLVGAVLWSLARPYVSPHVAPAVLSAMDKKIGYEETTATKPAASTLVTTGTSATTGTPR